jgi:hypothetical protein
MLVSVNPNKPLRELYSDALAAAWREGRGFESSGPHIYMVGQAALDGLHAREDQFVAFVGQACSGKSAAFNHFVHYIAGTSPHCAVNGSMASAQFLLASFGNAATSRNLSSSRMGQNIQFRIKPNPGQAAAVLGATMQVIMLERTRVHRVPTGECSFHIFHQLWAAPPQSGFAKLLGAGGGQGGLKFAGGVLECESSDQLSRRSSEFERLLAAMDTVGITQAQQMSCLRAAAAVLALGNVKIESDNESGRVGSSALSSVSAALSSTSLRQEPLNVEQQSLADAAELLGCPIGDVRGALGSRRLSDESLDFTVHLHPKQAARNRDGLARVLYARLFHWIVEKINSRWHSPELPESGVGGVRRRGSSITALELPAVDRTTRNGFHQLLVQYADEKLQQQIMYAAVQRPEAEYDRQMVEHLPVPFENNAPTVSLFENGTKQVAGLFALLDAQGNRGQHGSDLHFLQGVSQLIKHVRHRKVLETGKYQQLSLLSTPSTAGEPSFSVRHYGKNVNYKVTGFRCLNEEGLHKDVIELVLARQCSDSFMASLLEDGRTELIAVKRRREADGSRITVCSAHQTIMQAVVDRMEKSHVHWVRCLRPNGRDVAGSFDEAVVAEQLRYSGLVSTLKFSRKSYPKSLAHAEFLRNFAVCEFDKELTGGIRHKKQQRLVQSSATQPQKKKLNAARSAQMSTTFALRHLMHSLRAIDPAKYAIGTTRIFLKRGTYERLEDSRRHVLPILQTTAQAFGRGFLARSYVRRVKENIAAAETIQRCWKGRYRRRWGMTFANALAKKAADEVARLAAIEEAKRLQAEQKAAELRKQVAAASLAVTELQHRQELEMAELGLHHAYHHDQLPEERERLIAEAKVNMQRLQQQQKSDELELHHLPEEERARLISEAKAKKQNWQGHDEDEDEDAVEWTPPNAADSGYHLPWALIQLPKMKHLLFEFYSENRPAFANRTRIKRIISTFKRATRRETETSTGYEEALYAHVADSHGIDPRLWWLEQQPGAGAVLSPDPGGKGLRARPKTPVVGTVKAELSTNKHVGPKNNLRNPPRGEILPVVARYTPGASQSLQSLQSLQSSFHGVGAGRSSPLLQALGKGKAAPHAQQPKRRLPSPVLWSDSDSSLPIPDKTELHALFKRMDTNGNGLLSLAEIDKAVSELWPQLNNKPAMMRAYKAADRSGNGFIERKEFRMLLNYLAYFNDVWHKFELVDTDGNRRIDWDEFQQQCDVFCSKLSAAEARTEFSMMDGDGGGFVRFDEFCIWCAHRHLSARWEDSDESRTSTPVSTNSDDAVKHTAEATSDRPAPHPAKRRGLSPTARWDDELVEQLMAMGYGRDGATAALTACGGVVQRAADWLLAGPAETPAAATAELVAPAPPSTAPAEPTMSTSSVEDSEESEESEYLLVACPPGVSPGQMVSVSLPDGRDLEVGVPEGVVPGEEFEVFIGELNFAKAEAELEAELEPPVPEREPDPEPARDLVPKPFELLPIEQQQLLLPIAMSPIIDTRTTKGIVSPQPKSPVVRHTISGGTSPAVSEASLDAVFSPIPRAIVSLDSSASPAAPQSISTAGVDTAVADLDSLFAMYNSSFGDSQ